MPCTLRCCLQSRRLGLVSPKILLILASISLLLSATVEILIMFPVPAWVYTPIAIVVIVSLWPIRPLREHPMRLASLVIVCALIAGLYFAPWSPRKQFLRSLYSIQPGMTIEEARTRMSGFMEGTGMTSPYTNQEFEVGGAIVFRHSNDGRLNADWGVVTIQNGKVVSVRFDPD